MREILFRGKSIDNGEWVKGDFAHPKNIVWEEKGYDEMLKREDDIVFDEAVFIETVGQYTGLTDKNGKKIFEGDIVRSGDSKFTFKIEERNAAYYAICIEVGTKSYLHNVAKRGCSIIGKTYDNPELLEVKK